MPFPDFSSTAEDRISLFVRLPFWPQTTPTFTLFLDNTHSAFSDER